jgi:uncharacterized protein YkwD
MAGTGARVACCFVARVEENGMPRIASGVIAIGLALGLAAASPGWAEGEPASLEELRDASLELVNEAREAEGLERLRLDPVLNDAARAHGRDMLERGFYDHVTPDGQDPRDRYLAAGGSTDAVVAENIARCEDCPVPAGLDDLEWMHEGWMESPGHRENILMPGLSHYGFGVVDSEEGTILGVQTFAGAGTPRPDEQADTPAMPAAEQNELAASLVNELRREAGAAPVEASEHLAAAAAAVVPDDFAADDVQSLAPPEDVLADGQGWTRLRMLAGGCSGCGETATAADVRFFVRQWRESPDPRQALADEGAEAIGMAVIANGRGSKIGVALLAGD